MSEYEKGFYDCKRIILLLLSGFFAGLFGEQAFEKSAIYKMITSIVVLNKNEQEQ